MATDPDPHDRDTDDPEEQPTADGLVDSDDTTMADAGLTGGTGAAEGEGTVTPYGTEPEEDEEEVEDEH